MKNLFAGLTFIFFAFFIFCSVHVSAQDNQAKTINGGVLNGKAIDLPKPVYPAEAREVKAEGTVAVRITIDEAGNVISAEADMEDFRKSFENGDLVPPESKAIHPALREAAENAAREAKFSPTTLSGQPVKVTGRIVYNFVAGDRETENHGKKISGGVLNGKARSLPKPVYPAAAAAIGAEGAVSVAIVVDEEGNVVSARAVSGHPLLRAATVAAAMEAKFAPTMLSGELVKVSGILIYNFVAPKGEDQ